MEHKKINKAVGLTLKLGFGFLGSLSGAEETRLSTQIINGGLRFNWFSNAAEHVCDLIIFTFLLLYAALTAHCGCVKLQFIHLNLVCTLIVIKKLNAYLWHFSPRFNRGEKKFVRESQLPLAFTFPGVVLVLDMNDSLKTPLSLISPFEFKARLNDLETVSYIAFIKINCVSDSVWSRLWNCDVKSWLFYLVFVNVIYT